MITHVSKVNAPRNLIHRKFRFSETDETAHQGEHGLIDGLFRRKKQTREVSTAGVKKLLF